MDQHEHLISQIKAVLSLIAALLGIGTVAGVVNLIVGMLSACWLAYQLWVAINYDLPIKRAKLAVAKAGRRIPETQPGDL